MIGAIALAAALVSGQQSGALQGGGQYIVHRDSVAQTVAIELWYRVPSAGYDNANPGIARLTIAALAVSAPPHAASLAELVKRDGGSLTINVFPDIAMVGASVPSWQAPAVLKALTATFFAPSITDAGLKAAARDSAIVAAEQQFNTEQSLQNALFTRIFSNGPAHFPAVPAGPEFAKISAADVRAFAARGLRQQNAILSIAGNIGDAWLADVHSGIAQQPSAQDQPLDSTISNAPVDATAAGEVPGLGFAWTGPPIADSKAATAMDFIADYLFDASYGVVPAVLQKNAKPEVFTAGQFITLHNPGVLVATISGSGASGARAQVLQSVAAMSKPLDQKSFEAARNAFIYHILSESQTPSAHADNAGWYAAEGDAAYAPSDASGEYLQIARSLDAAYVASVAAKYLQHPAIVQLLAGPQSGGSPT